MDEEDFKKGIRVVLFIGTLIAAVMLFVGAGFQLHAWINKIDPDPPYCVTVTKDGQGYTSTQRHRLADPPEPTEKK